MKQPPQHTLCALKAIIGLGNPGNKFTFTRHNIGFRVLDALAAKYGGQWHETPLMETCTIELQGYTIQLIKPLTFMNHSGGVIPTLTKQGIKAENILVVHDELEKPFGTVSIKGDGSARGHNGLKSIIEQCGASFARLRVGIGRPADREDVGNYVLQRFSEQDADVDAAIEKAVALIEKSIR